MLVKRQDLEYTYYHEVVLHEWVATDFPIAMFFTNVSA